MSEGIDTSAAEQAVINEKLEAANAELAKYKQAEVDRVAASEAAKAKAMEDRIAAIEAEKIEMAKSFDEKLDKISMRASVDSKPNTENGEKLTKEQYETDKLKYDTIALKTMIPSAFD